MSSTHFRTCPLCEATCGLEIVIDDDGLVQRIRGDPDDTFSRGHLCPKALALGELHDDPDRLRRPQLREGERLREVSWPQAFDAAAAGIARVQERHGRDAVAIYFGNPFVHDYASMLFAKPFLDALQSRSRFSAASVDGLPAMLASLLMYGHQWLIPVPDLDRAEHLLIFGANPIVSNGSIMTAPGVARRLRELRSRGGKVVVFDPRRTATAQAADEHHFVRPGTDGLLLLSLIGVILGEGLATTGRLRALAVGWDRLGALAAQHPPEAVADTVGIKPDTIRRLAREFAGARRAVCYGRVGVSTQAFGAVCSWLINALNIVTGNLDRAGGAMFPNPAVDLPNLARLTGEPSTFGRRRTRVRGLPEFCGELPVAALAEEIETSGDGAIRALITFAGNPVLSSPGGGRLENCLARLEWMVSIDPYLNETTRHADVILPCTSALERDHYPLVSYLTAVRNRSRYSRALYPPPAGARHDWQILLELQGRLEKRGPPGLRVIREARRTVLERLGPRGLLDLALRFGPYGPRPWRAGLTLAGLERAPHGLDLGPLEPVLPANLRTRDRRIALAPEPLAADVARLRRMLRRPAQGLLLIGRRQALTNNSWMHNAPRLMRGRDRCTLLMHPRDAEALHLVGGRSVEVASAAGSVVVPLELSDEIMPGVVSLPHGFGHDRPGTRLSVAAGRPGASANDVTDSAVVDELSGTAVLNGVPVTVRELPDSGQTTPSGSWSAVA